MTTTTLRDFRDEGQYGLLSKASMEGSGRAPGQALVRMAPKSSTKKRAVPTKKGTTNPLYLMKFLRSSGLVVSGFALEGTPQGHLYNGMRIDRTRGPRVSELRIANIPGNSDINPGETFALNFYRCQDIALGHTEIDGGGIGASGVGFNTCGGGLRVVSVTAHDLKFCKAIALWKQDGGGIFQSVQSLNNAFAYGFERCDGEYELNDNKFRGSRRADIHLANDGGQYGRAKIVINDPDLPPGQRVKVLLSKTELGNPNKQTAADVRLFVKGKSRPDLLHFVTRA